MVSPFLNMCNTLASFQTSGKTHRIREQLNGTAASFSRQLFIPSGPVVLEISKLEWIFKTSIADTTFWSIL